MINKINPVSIANPTHRVILLIDSSISTRMLSAFTRLADTLPLSYKLIPFNIDKLGKLTTPKIGKSGNELKTLVADESRRPDFNKLIKRLADTYSARYFVVASSSVNLMVSGYDSLDKTRGSLYEYNYSSDAAESAPSARFFPIAELSQMFTTEHGKWVLSQDLLKINRFVLNKPRSFPKFKYKVARELRDLDELASLASTALFISCDIETSGTPTMISCIGYTLVQPSGEWLSYVVPLINPTKLGQAHWPSLEDEVLVWQKLKRINATKSSRFIFHNGQYDGSYLVRYGIPTTNYLWDTMHMWHSLYCELPKSLKFVTSLANDYYRFWKDEISGGEDEDKGSKDKSKIPVSLAGIERYWRYNALDTYNTMCCFFYQLALMRQPSLAYAIRNYSQEFALQMEYLLIGYKGFRLLRNRLNQTIENKAKEELHELNRLRYWLGEPEFNPSSARHKATMFYEILGAKPVKLHGKEVKSTDKQALGQIQYQHPLIKRFVDQLHKITVNQKFISDFGNVSLDNGRMLYSLNSAGTDTSRASSSKSPFWIGRNMQNIAPEIRESLVADEGYVLFDIDYSQSDNYFVAYESEDPMCISVVNDPRDTHCIHTAHFFKMSYDDVYNDPHKKAKDSPRSCAKKIVHGCNYDMQARTMFINICAELGKEALYKAASLMGYKEPWSLSDSQLIDICDKLRKSYFELYPHLASWTDRLVKECHDNGGRLTTAFGFTRKFFGNFVTESGVHRKMASFKGQGGTSGNINRALYQYYYGRGDGKPSLYKQGMRILLQVHDSLVGEVPLGKIELIDELISIMEQPVTIKGREMHVPVEADVGFTWSKSMIGYSPAQKGSELVAKLIDFENKTFRAKYGEKPLAMPEAGPLAKS